MKKTKSLFLAIFVILGLVWGLISQWPDGKLHLIQCDVGQGDAILLTHGFSQVLVDGGPNARVMECLSDNMPFWDHTLELVVATHPDKDHIAGLSTALERYQVSLFVSVNVANNTTVFRNLQAVVWENQVPVHVAQRGEEITVGKINLKILSPEKSSGNLLVWQQNSQTQDSEGDSSNDQSVVMRAGFGEFDVLLTGDITSQVEQSLARRDDLSGIEVLKVSHHGSKYSSSQAFLEAVRPKLAVIGVGKNQWGHPAGEVLQRLQDLRIPAGRTDLDGSIEVVSDGRTWYRR